MKRLRYSILSFVVVLFTLFSCNNEELDLVDLTENRNVNVTLSLSMNGDFTYSRATQYEEIGNDIENKIDISQLNVFFIYGSTIKKVENISAYKESQNIYKLSGTIVLPTESYDYRIMVFANCGNEINLNEGWQNLDFDINQDLIPMWGVKTYNDMSFEIGKNYDLGTIPVLRSIAKIEMNLGTGWSDDCKIQNLSLNNYNSKGYCVSKGGETLADINTDEDWMHEYVSSASSLYFNVSEDGKSAFVYLPEYGSTTNLSYSIKVNGKDYSFSFNSDNNTDFNSIVRNHIYNYTVNLIDEKPKTDVIIGSWWLRKSQIWWNAEGLYSFLSPNGTDMSGKDYLDFTFTLNLNNNSDNQGVEYGALWSVSLSNGLDFELVDEPLNNGKTSVSHGLARTDSYTIRVRAKNDKKSVNTDLYIKVDGVNLKIGPNSADHVTITKN